MMALAPKFLLPKNGKLLKKGGAMKNDPWKTILAELEVTLTRGTFQTLFSQTQLLSLEGDVATIACSNTYLRDLIEKRYYSLLKNLLDKKNKRNNSLVFVVQKTEAKPPKNQDLGPLFEKTAPALEEVARKAHLRGDFTFENFCVSSSNQMAYAAAQAVVKKPGTAYNPLFLYGGVGVGKTHLMQAIGHALLAKKPNFKVIYCMSEEFTNEIIEAIKERNTKTFKTKFRGTDILLLDDVQFIAGKMTVQEEFFHTFNVLYREGKQIVLISDRPPLEIAKLEARLRSRFEGGLTIDIQPPDFELRTAILLTKAKPYGLELPMDIAKLVAANIEDTRRLEGFLRRLLTEVETKKVPLTPELVSQLLGTTGGPEEKGGGKVSFKEFIEGVVSFYDLKIHQLKGPKRAKPIAYPRQVLMYLLRTDLNLTLEEVGEILGGRDHTTVIHGVEKITNLLPVSEKIREEIRLIREKVYGEKLGIKTE